MTERTLREELNALAARQAQADAQITDIRRDIKQIRSDTGEVVEMFRALSGGFKVLQGLGKLLRPIGWIAGALTACIVFWQTFKGWTK